MYLVYRPTGDAVFLGKRMGWGWSGTPENVAERILELFNKSKDGIIDFSQDDFAIAMEQGENQPHVISKYRYKHPQDSGNICTLVIDESVPYGKPESI